MIELEPSETRHDLSFCTFRSLSPFGRYVQSMNFLRTHVCVALAALLFLSGCGTTKVEGTPPDEQNLKTLSILYGQFRGKMRRPPANLAEFKKFLESTKADTGAELRVEGDVEKFLISPRDNQPYVILWNVNARTGIPDPVAYEQTGASGTRMVGLGSGAVEFADEERFKALVPNAK